MKTKHPTQACRSRSTFHWLLSSTLVVLWLGACSSAPQRDAEGKRIPDLRLSENAERAKREFISADPEMATYFKSATGYAIFPSIAKGGIGIGGAYGEGCVYENGNLIGYTDLAQVTIGFQLGGQSFREVIFFQTERALNKFRAEKFEFSANASAIAVTTGASTANDYEGGVAVFTMAKGGLMFEASIGGQKFSYEPK